MRDAEALTDALAKFGLGAGETSAVLLATEIKADLVLVDDWRGRRLAKQEGL